MPLNAKGKKIKKAMEKEYARRKASPFSMPQRIRNYQGSDQGKGKGQEKVISKIAMFVLIWLYWLLPHWVMLVF